MKYLTLALLVLAACSQGKNDVLDDLGQSVLKSKEGLNIEIRPEKNP